VPATAASVRVNWLLAALASKIRSSPLAGLDPESQLAPVAQAPVPALPSHVTVTANKEWVPRASPIITAYIHPLQAFGLELRP